MLNLYTFKISNPFSAVPSAREKKKMDLDKFKALSHCHNQKYTNDGHPVFKTNKV